MTPSAAATSSATAAKAARHSASGRGPAPLPPTRRPGRPPRPPLPAGAGGGGFGKALGEFFARAGGGDFVVEHATLVLQRFDTILELGIGRRTLRARRARIDRDTSQAR